MSDIKNFAGYDIKDATAREALTVTDPTIVAPDVNTGLITFGVDAQGNYGYKKVGADTVTPFKSEAKVETVLFYGLTTVHQLMVTKFDKDMKGKQFNATYNGPYTEQEIDGVNYSGNAYNYNLIGSSTTRANLPNWLYYINEALENITIESVDNYTPKFYIKTKNKITDVILSVSSLASNNTSGSFSRLHDVGADVYFKSKLASSRNLYLETSDTSSAITIDNMNCWQFTFIS